MVRPAGFSHRPFTRAVAVALTLAKERQHPYGNARTEDLMFWVLDLNVEQLWCIDGTFSYSLDFRN